MHSRLEESGHAAQDNVTCCTNDRVIYVSGRPLRKTSILEDRETIRQLAQQVRQLQQKVTALEAKQELAASAAADGSSVAHADDASERLSQLATFQEAHEVRGIRWRGFGEVNY
jgi:outer membrane murein-binding lipoprotein Lpp